MTAEFGRTCFVLPQPHSPRTLVEGPEPLRPGFSQPPVLQAIPILLVVYCTPNRSTSAYSTASTSTSWFMSLRNSARPAGTR